MRVISMLEFREICEEIAPATFIFDTEDQAGGDNESLKHVVKYDRVVTMINPDRICFIGDSGTLCLNRIKSICFHDSDAVVSFSIICSNPFNESPEIPYVILTNIQKIGVKLY